MLLVRFLIPLTGEPWALFMGVAFGLGSIAFPFATMLFGHALSAATLFAAFWLLHRWRRTAGRWEPVLAGFLAGWSVLTEIPVGLGVAVLAVYALWLGRGVALRFVLGGLPVALLLGGYNWVVFGSPFSLGYQYATIFAAQNAQGIVSIVLPSPAVLVDLLLNPRGLLRARAVVRARAARPAARRATARSAARCSCARRCASRSSPTTAARSTRSAAGRRVLATSSRCSRSPTILVALAPRRIRIVTVILVAYSLVTMLVATATRPNAQELYENPLLQLWLPRLLSGDLADTLAWRRFGLTGWAPLLLLGIGLVVAAVAILATTRRGRAAEGTTIAARVILALLVVAVALPIPAGAAVDLPVTGSLAGGPAITIPASGAYRLTAGGEDRMLMWARIQNAGGPLAGRAHRVPGHAARRRAGVGRCGTRASPCPRPTGAATTSAGRSSPASIPAATRTRCWSWTRRRARRSPPASPRRSRRRSRRRSPATLAGYQIRARSAAGRAIGEPSCDVERRGERLEVRHRDVRPVVGRRVRVDVGQQPGVGLGVAHPPDRGVGGEEPLVAASCRPPCGSAPWSASRNAW